MMRWPGSAARASRRPSRRLREAVSALATGSRPDAVLGQQRLVVLDLETTGLDPRHDRVLSIGAVALQGRDVLLGDSFEALLYLPDHVPAEATVVHGITPSAVRQGEEPAEAWLRFLRYLGDAWLLAFHADFDRAFLQRACQQHLGVKPEHRCLDLADLAPMLCPQAALPRGSLDQWLACAGIAVHARHQAIFDALASAELALWLLARLPPDTPLPALAERLQQWRQLQGLQGSR